MHLLATLLALAPMQVASNPATETVVRRGLVMGAPLELEVEAPSRSVGLQASETVLKALEAAEERLSNWDAKSEVETINRSPIGQICPLSTPLRWEIEQALHWSERTEGAFSPLVGPLLDAWDQRGQGRLPSSEELQGARQLCLPVAIQLDSAGWCRLRDARLATGGFGKGAGLRCASLSLAATRESLVVRCNLGGQWLFMGPEPSWFAVSIADPDRRHEALLHWTVRPGSVATSGNSERALLLEGKTYGHLIDPRTGWPAPDFGSVSVWCADPLAADALSTALFVLGPEQGLALAETLPGVEAVFVQRTPLGKRVLATQGTRDHLCAASNELPTELPIHWRAPGAEPDPIFPLPQPSPNP